MCFTCGTGEPVLCVVILKSEQDVKDIPLAWKWGIDITKNANNVGQCQAGFCLKITVGQTRLYQVVQNAPSDRKKFHVL